LLQAQVAVLRTKVEKLPGEGVEFKDFVPLITAALGASLFGYLGAYFGGLGKLQVEKQERDYLRRTLSDNTETVKSIEGRLNREDFLGRHELEFRERQLAEFYGPVYGYLKSQRDIYNMWMDGMLDEKNLEIKQLFAKQNAIVRDLIIRNVHLIDSSDMPEYFVTYLTNTLIFEMYAAATADGMVPERVAEDPRAKFPDEFEEHVFHTTIRLKQRTEALNANFAIKMLHTS
jgi:hypothetical protein